MFTHIEDKLKKLAKLLSRFGIIVGTIYMVFGLFKLIPNFEYLKYSTMYGETSNNIWRMMGDAAYHGLHALKFGSLCSFICIVSSWLFYAFGELLTIMYDIRKALYFHDKQDTTDAQS